MRTLCVLIIKNLSRNRMRTILTALAVIVFTMVYSIVGSTTSMVNRLVSSSSSNTRLVVVNRWITPSELPARYIDQVTRVRDVEDWTVWHYYFGFLDESKRSDRFALGIATRMENLQAMHPGLEEMEPESLRAMKHNKSGALVGQNMMDAMKWQIGQRFTLFSATHPGKNLDFRIVGIVPAGKWGNNFFFREDYFRQATGDEDTVNVIWLRVGNEETGQRIAATVEQMFSNSREEVKVETEAASAARIAGKAESILAIVNMVVLVLLFDMLVVISNSISISTRERRTEMALLKVMGYSPNFIIVMVVSEALIVGSVSGGLGAGMAYGLSALNEADQLPYTIPFLRMFPVPMSFVPRGVFLGALAAFLGSIVPAWTARKIKVTEVFSNIA